MGRIRTIKPEFPQSESMGRISRDARLCFIQLWTLADDSGRLRGSSRMLASLLYPYDDDAKDLIDGWLDELDRNDCIRRYKVDGDSYIEICKWLIHQKIDRPTPSKIPPFDESSRVLASPRESSALDQGRDQGRDQGKDQGRANALVGRKLPTCPYQDVVNLYNEILPTLPPVRLLGDSRKKAINAFWKWVLTSKRSDGTRRATSAEEGVAVIRAYFERASANDFLMGRVVQTGAHSGWRCDFDFLLTDRGKKHVIEKTEESQ